MLLIRVRSFVLSAITCWLVLLASGDDINLVRILLPANDVSLEEVMTLDDPNADFTESDTSLAVAQGQSSGEQGFRSAASLHPSTRVHARLRSRDVSIPLRC